MTVRLHVNVDHVATLRQARGVSYPDPVRAARACVEAGADGITVHLREDRRHIQDDDVRRLRSSVRAWLNLEMAATDGMVRIASEIRPDLVTLVPEKREERTTEGGLDVAARPDAIEGRIRHLGDAGVPVSLFIDPDVEQVRAAVAIGARRVELHTGDYADSSGDGSGVELARLLRAAAVCPPGLGLAAGHGLTLDNLAVLVQALPSLEEVNIGHALVCDAVFLGREAAVRAYRRAIERAEGAAPTGGVSP